MTVCVAILLMITVPLQAQRELRVAIYPYIPDLAKDKLQTLITWIETRFEAENPEIDLQVSTPTCDIYDINEVRKCLTDNPTAPHVLEIDMMLLGDLVDEDLIISINPQAFGLNTIADYVPFTLEAVQYKGNYYAVPTNICGNYLMGINVGNITETCPVQNGVADYTNLSNVLNQCKQDLLFPPRTMTLTGNLERLPIIYIDAYIDFNGPDSVYEAVDSDIGAQTGVIANMKSFINYCQTQQENKCYEGAFESVDEMVTTIVENQQTITGYSYSEFTGAYLQHAITNDINIDVYSIIAPPLGPENNFIMFTDALVINKALLTNASTTILQDINTFMNFYSRLTTRLSIAFGSDLPEPHPPRYLMQARADFYTTQQVKDDEIYSQLTTTLQYAVAAPNNEFWDKQDEMNKQIKQALNFTNG